jgi:hypothetical protein
MMAYKRDSPTGPHFIRRSPFQQLDKRAPRIARRNSARAAAKPPRLPPRAVDNPVNNLGARNDKFGRHMGIFRPAMQPRHENTIRFNGLTENPRPERVCG